MRLLASLPAHLAVIALLAWLALRLFAAAEKKSRSGRRWLLFFFVLWLGTLGLTACAARFGYERHFHTRPGFWLVYAVAVACAFAAALALRWVLAKKPALSTGETAAPAERPLPPTPLPQPAPAPVRDEPRLTPPLPPAPRPEPAPPAEPVVFKFACPHCGQRLAVTTAEVGTVADCPNCATPLEVPTPPLDNPQGARDLPTA